MGEYLDSPDMDSLPSFVKAYLEQALPLQVEEPLFIRNSYHLEVHENGKKSAFPFLQMDDAGQLTNSFCSCKLSDAGLGCPHMAAGVLRIFNHTELPLHVRFERSFWAALFQILQKQDRSPEVTAKTAKGKELLAKERSLTEKAALVSLEEMENYKKGEASPWLTFELSPLADLAKWLMHQQDMNASYEIRFQEVHELPLHIEIDFPDLLIKVSLRKEDLATLIPTLSTVKSPLQILSKETTSIEEIRYDSSKKALLITRSQDQKSSLKGKAVGDFLYIAKTGFVRNTSKKPIEKPEISASEIPEALNESMEIIHRFIPVHPEKRACKYLLYFDKEQNLHIELYVLNPKEKLTLFYPWVYVESSGFFLLDDWFFETEEKIVFKEQVGDFVRAHQGWLHHYPGFQVHLSSFESRLSYRLTEHCLCIQAKLDFPEGEIFYFDQWIYLKGQGFYRKREAKTHLIADTEIALNHISDFLDKHKDDLEQVEGFFSPRPLVEKMGLKISLDRSGKIFASPEMHSINQLPLKRFGHYVYADGFGFYELPPNYRLPERYQKETEITAVQIEALRPFALSVDPRLERPQHLHLKVDSIAPVRGQKGRLWWFQLHYESPQGSIDLISLWEALLKKEPYLFSNAGLIALKDPRFSWVRQLKKKQLDRSKNIVKLRTIDWIRLSITETIIEPSDPKMRIKLSEIAKLEITRPYSLASLQSTLRPYQEQGVNWLWYLYCHGLSGLLCDDMGLGKTHQAMALLSAICNEDKKGKNKYLVVCPTSVIYHWQEQLLRFLPHIRVCTYYGIERSLEDFESHYDLLLTSYGILRTGKKALKGHHFELAIFDEIQVAKNHASQTHIALRATNAEMKLGLTGTPIENNLRELKSLFDLVLPTYLPPEAEFRELYINPIEKEGLAESKSKLAKLISPFILRRKKSEVLTDLPEKIEEIAYSDLSDEQTRMYKTVAYQMRDTLYQDLKDETKPVSLVHVFSALSTLKQICDHPSLILGDLKNYRDHASGKWDLFVELINEARSSGQKVVVFSQYLNMLEIIEAHLKRENIRYASIKGSTRDRPQQLKMFREDPECAVFVASLLAAGVGIDLTAGSVVIHYDRWWNPAKENQATDRVHRIGQNRGVQVFKLVVKNTIEEHIHEMIEKKKGLLEDIIGESDEINYLSRDELLHVFEKMFKEDLN